MDGKWKRVIGMFLAHGCCKGNSVCSVLWVTGSRSPVHLVFSCTWRPLWAWPVLNQGTKMKNIFSIPPASYTWRTTVCTEIKSGLYKRLKFIPRMWCGCAWMSVAHVTGNISHWREMHGEGRAQEAEMHTEQSATTAMNQCLKSRL